MLRRPWTFPVLLSVLALALLALAACADGAVEEAQLVSPSVTTAQAPVNRPTPRTVVQPPLPPLVVDLHLDTVTTMVEQNLPWSDERLEGSLPALAEAGVNVVVEAAWIPRGDPNPRGTGIGKIRRIRNMVRQSGGRAALVTGPDQLERVVRDGRIAVVIALEGGTALIEGEKTLREFRELGLSVLGLTWTESSPYADSSAEPRKGAAGGLTESGRRMVGLANDLGLILDVSHMSDRATAETVALSRAPVMASHSNSRALCDVPRNLSDELLSAIADKGGLVGVMFHSPFLVKGRPASQADVLAQIRGVADRVGTEHVGLGSDWDGKIRLPSGLESARRLPELRQKLVESGLEEGQVRQIWGDNFLRLWKAVAAGRRAPPPR